ncbi:MAG: LysE family transporter [Candidatus Dactylopiibacterium sp.]|nr:LysE family transporter [Candidatus Dactylopiibacterium sp.]
MSLDTWLAFFVASWLISLSPGPGALSCMAAGQRFGFRHALWNIVGLQLGVLLLVAVCAAGLGAVLAASHTLFMGIKWAGVAYLIWLGIQQWRSPAAPMVDTGVTSADRRSLIVKAFLINASNPKGIVFMLAVLPQFIDPHATQWPQYLICGATLFFTDAVVMSGYTLLAARVLRALRDARHIRWLNRGFGSLFIGAGLLLAGFRRQ